MQCSGMCGPMNVPQMGLAVRVAFLVCSLVPVGLALDLRGRAPVPVVVADGQGDLLARATLQVQQESLETQLPGPAGPAAPGMPGAPGAGMPPPGTAVMTDVDAQAAAAAALAAAAGPQLSDASCAMAAQRLGALTCSLVTSQPPGFAPPEGCECRLEAATCPPADPTLGFTGVSPSQTFSLPEMKGLSVVLCMYWQWLGSPDKSMENAMAAAQTAADAEKMVQQARQRADAWVIQTMGPLGPAPCPAPGPCPHPAPAPAPAPFR